MELGPFDTKKTLPRLREHGAQTVGNFTDRTKKINSVIGGVILSGVAGILEVTMGPASRFVNLTPPPPELPPTEYYEEMKFRTNSSGPPEPTIDFNLSKEDVQIDLDTGRD